MQYSFQFGLIVVAALNYGSSRPIDCGYEVGGSRNEKCPRMVEDDDLWQCLNKRLNCREGLVYHCLRNEQGTWTEVCSKEELCDMGKEPMVTNAGNIVCRYCYDSERYNPEKDILSNKLSECPNIKTQCVKEKNDLIECEEPYIKTDPNSKYKMDRKCRCSYEEDEIPWFYDISRDNWTCSFPEVMQCLYSPCPKADDGRNHTRGIGYRCYPVETVSLVAASTPTASSKLVTRATEEDKRTTTTLAPKVTEYVVAGDGTEINPESPYRYIAVAVAVPVVTVVAIVALVVLAYIFYKYKRKRSTTQSQPTSQSTPQSPSQTPPQQPPQPPPQPPPSQPPVSGTTIFNNTIYNVAGALNNMQGPSNIVNIGRSEDETTGDVTEEPSAKTPLLLGDVRALPKKSKEHSENEMKENKLIYGDRNNDLMNKVKKTHQHTASEVDKLNSAFARRSNEIPSTSTVSMDASVIPVSEAEVGRTRSASESRKYVSTGQANLKAVLKSTTDTLSSIELQNLLETPQKLEGLYKQVINSVIMDLKTMMNPQIILDCLRQHQLGTEYDYINIQHAGNGNPLDQNDEILHMITTRGFDAYKQFKEILCETKYINLLQQIKEEEEKKLKEAEEKKLKEAAEKKMSEDNETEVDANSMESDDVDGDESSSYKETGKNEVRCSGDKDDYEKSEENDADSNGQEDDETKSFHEESNEELSKQVMYESSV